MNKAGWQTTELWLSIAALILVNVGGTIDGSPTATKIGTALVALGYVLARTLTKINAGETVPQAIMEAGPVGPPGPAGIQGPAAPVIPVAPAAPKAP